MFQKIFILSIFSLLLTGLYLNQDNLQAGGACTNGQDNKAKQAMKNEMNKCDTFTTNPCPNGDSKCFGDCVQKIGFTPACSSCLNDMIECFKTKCKEECGSDAHSDDCKICNRKQCYAAFVTCSGWTEL